MKDKVGGAGCDSGACWGLSASKRHVLAISSCRAAEVPISLKVVAGVTVDDCWWRMAMGLREYFKAINEHTDAVCAANNSNYDYGRKSKANKRDVLTVMQSVMPAGGGIITALISCGRVQLPMSRRGMPRPRRQLLRYEKSRGWRDGGRHLQRIELCGERRAA